MKKKIIDKTLIITTVVSILPILFSLALYSRLPEQVAIHFDTAGNPDNYVPKAWAAFGLPVLMTCICIFTNFVMNADPKRDSASNVMRMIGKWAVPVLSVIMVPVTLFLSMGVPVPIQVIVPIIVGALIIVCGNYLPKCRRNYTVGIKLPWTLNSEENWNKTHHMAGYLWILGGIAILISGFLSYYSIPVVLIVALLLIAVPAIYSFCLYKRGL